MPMLLRALKRVVTIAKRHKFATLFLVVAAVLIVPDLAFAQDRSTISQGLEIFISFFGQMLTVVAYAIGQLIILVIGTIVIPILGYNDFGSSPVISLGWSLVRDVVNMFVIIVILYMAFLTIIGNPKANIQQQLPKLLLAVVLLNFSKTITLLIVDIGQVVMMTFVNAIQDIAIGNFVQLFGVNEFFSLSADAGVNAALNGGYDAGVFTATAYATVALMIMVLVILLILAAAYLYRIIMIWVLVVMSPLAWFMKGAGDLFSSSGGVYQQWWKQLSSVVILGPVLTFFLWLALAVASEGSLAAAAGFNSVPPSDFTTGLATSPLAEQDRFLSTLLAMILLLVGLRASGQFSEGFGEVGKRFLNQGFGQRLLKGAITAPAQYGYRGARGAATGARKVGGFGMSAVKYGGNLALQNTQIAEKAGEFFGVSGANTARNVLQGFPVGGNAIAGTVAGGLATVGAGITGAGVAAKAAARKDRKERADKLSKAQKAQELTGMVDAEGKPNYQLPGARQLQYELLGNLATDGDLQKELKAQLENKYRVMGRPNWEQDAKDKFEKMMADSLKYVKANEDDLIEGEGAKKGLLKTRAKYLHMLDNEDDIKDVIDHEDFRIGMLEAAAINDDGTAADANRDIIRRLLKNKVTGYSTTNDGSQTKRTLWTDIQAGKGISDSMKQAVSGELGAKEIPVAELTTASRSDLAKSFKFGKTDLRTVTAAHLAASGDLVDAIADAEVDNLSAMDAAAQAELARQIRTRRALPSTDIGLRQKMSRALFNLDKGGTTAATDAFDIIPTTTLPGGATVAGGAFGGTAHAEQRDAFSAQLQSDISSIVNPQIRGLIGAGGTNEVTSTIAETVSSRLLNQLKSEYGSGIIDASRKAEIRETVEALEEALRADRANNTSLSNKEKDRYRDLAREASLKRRQMT